MFLSLPTAGLWLVQRSTRGSKTFFRPRRSLNVANVNGIAHRPGSGTRALDPSTRELVGFSGFGCTKACRHERRPFSSLMRASRLRPKTAHVLQSIFFVSIPTLFGDRKLAQERSGFVRKRNQANFFVASQFAAAPPFRVSPAACPPVSLCLHRAGGRFSLTASEVSPRIGTMRLHRSF